MFPPNTFTPWQFPCRVDGHATRNWFHDEHSLRRFADDLFARQGHGPRRFRAWAAVGNSDRLEGEWVARDTPADLGGGRWRRGAPLAVLQVALGLVLFELI
jgi:hypothetical protein